jgi:U32 family peptidase
MCLAAVHNGADAISAGMPGFNARGRTETLSLENLSHMVAYCHLYGVKVFLAFNVLIFEQELNEVRALLQDVMPLGIDAFIVQDIGLVRLIKSINPEQVVHASTQMTVTCAEAIDCTSNLDISRYVLARELSLTEIQAIRTATEKELEVFVHGALCVSYSGQCLTSESLGGRSANRGQCAQSCRLPYEVIVDGKVIELGAKRYVVSPKDLCSLEEINTLKEIGIDSFKIEGRLKSPEYVGATSRAYKNGLQEAQHPEDLAVIYSRDFFSGWLHGVDHQKLVRGDFSSNSGLEIGVIIAVEHSALIITSTYPLKNGQGLLFMDPLHDVRVGSPIYSVEKIHSNTFRIGIDHKLDLTSIKAHMLVFLNSAPEIEKSLKASYTQRDHLKRIPIQAVLSGAVGELLHLQFIDQDGRMGCAVSEEVLSLAQKSPVSYERTFEELSALSATPYLLSTLDLQVDSLCFINQRSLRKLRQVASQQLSQARCERSALALNHSNPLQLKAPLEKKKLKETENPRLSVLLREEAQIEALKGLNVTNVYLDFEYGKHYERAIDRVRELGFKAGLATTRILKPKELGHLNYIKRLKPDLVLVRNLGAFEYLKSSGLTLVGDFSLNITNSITADWFFNQGLQTLTPSYDLNQEQLAALLEHSHGSAFEVTIHQYMPAFHMEHCVFASCLSTGSSWRDCGKPCEKHRVELRTSDGTLHPLKADAECRNTMFNGKAQSAARLLPTLLALDVYRFRFEALFETGDELARKISSYTDLITGNLSIDQLLAQSGALEQYGVSNGQLLSIRTYQDRKKRGGLVLPTQVREVLEKELSIVSTDADSIA